MGVVEEAGERLPVGVAGLTDAELIRGVGGQLEDGFGALFDRHHRAVHRYLGQRVGTAAAEDLASETFLVALNRRTTYDGSHPYALPWLLGIATNLVRHHRRAEARHLARVGREMAVAQDRVPDPASTVDAAVSARADLARLRDRLAALSRRDRDTLLLYALGELTYAEVGVALGVPTGTVRSRLNRCRRLLGALPEPEPHRLRPAAAAAAAVEVCHD